MQPHVSNSGHIGNPRTNFRHGHTTTRTPEYISWVAAKGRCYNPKDPRFSDYGGRGIRVHDPWRRDFREFLSYLIATIGLRPPGMSIDRIDNDGDYAPGNIKWSTPKEQQNNKRGVVFLTFNGETKSTSQWADALGISRNTLGTRLRAGWTIKKALTTRLRRQGKSPDFVASPR